MSLQANFKYEFFLTDFMVFIIIFPNNHIFLAINNLHFKSKSLMTIYSIKKMKIIDQLGIAVNFQMFVVF